MRTILALSALLLAAPSLNAQRNVEIQRLGGGGKTPAPRAARVLVPGQPATFTLPAVEMTTLFSGDYSFSVDVPPGTMYLSIRLTTETPEADLDLYANFGGDVELDGFGNVIADKRSETAASGKEAISFDYPATGTYYIAFGAFTTDLDITATVTATITPLDCTATLDPPAASFNAAGGSAYIQVRASGIGKYPCQWTATSDSSWLIVQTYQGHTTDLLRYKVAANTGGARTGQIFVMTGALVANVPHFVTTTFTVTQSEPIAPPPPNALLLSQFVGGSLDWTTTLFLTNLSGSVESFHLRFYDDHGLPVAMPIADLGYVPEITATLAGGETRRYETSPAQGLLQAWAVLSPDTPGSERLSGFAVLRQKTPDSQPSEAIVPLAPPASRYVLVFDNTGGFVTAAALANPDSTTPLDVQAEIRDEQGMILATHTVSLAALGHSAFSLADQFPEAAGRRGSIHFTAPRDFSGLGLRFSPFATFTSFPLLTSLDIE